MAKGLTPTDRALWQQATKNVTPLGEASLSPVEGLPNVKVPVPHHVPYDPRVDLHGVTIHEAFARVQEHIATGAMLGYKRLTIITGKSGAINLEMPRWVERNPNVRSVESMNGGGAWEILLKRNT